MAKKIIDISDIDNNAGDHPASAVLPEELYTIHLVRENLREKREDYTWQAGEGFDWRVQENLDFRRALFAVITQSSEDPTFSVVIGCCITLSSVIM